MADARRVLLTGASGFVGTAVAPMLAAAGWTVVRGARDRLIEAVPGCDAVVHLAGRAHVMQEDGADSAALYHRDNVALTLDLARSAATAGVRRLVFLSTAKVFGEGREAPYRETDPPAPEDDYARSKLAAEEGLFALARETELEITVLRPPLVYGPGVRANFLSLLRAVDRGMPLPLGAIRNRRSLVSVTNLASAILIVLDRPGAAGRTFSVSDGTDVSTPDLIRAIAVALERPARLLPVPVAVLRLAAAVVGRAAAVDRLAGNLTLDTSAIRAAIGWAPRETLAQGLAATAQWYHGERIRP